jgi:asparagine synthetase B (glutamine-hydrolysing)
MCGIIGVVNGRKPIEGKLFEHSLNTVVSRRGPEGSYTFSDEEHGLRLGHAMLALSEVGCNEQPYSFINNHHHSVMVFNGEIYNWKKLNNKFNLGAKTDTQALLHGLVKVGPDFLKHVRGQFAFIAKVNRDGSP